MEVYHFFLYFGALGAHLISDRFGRRYTFVVCYMMTRDQFSLKILHSYNVSKFRSPIGLMIVITSNTLTNLLYGRVFVGLGVGYSFAVSLLL